MQLHLLRQTTCLTISYDAGNDWLFLDWEGELTLPVVQEACLALAACFLHCPYPLVLNSNAQVTGVSWSVAAWLATDFLPYTGMAGIEHLAWVCAPSLPGHNMVQTIINWLPGSFITSFNDLEAATRWLEHLRLERGKGYLLPTRLPATQAKLAQEVQSLRQRVAAAATRTSRRLRTA